MLPGPDVVFECPGCKALARLQTVSSGNTFGSTLWSDGKLDAPMLPETPIVTECPGCSTIYWVEDTRELGKFSSYTLPGAGGSSERTPEEWRRAPRMKPLDADACRRYLSVTTALPLQRERYLRMKLWHALNELDRVVGNANARWSYGASDAGFAENLNALMALLGETEEEILLRGECLRELGRFDEAIEVLSKISSDHWVASQLVALARSGIPVVVELQRP